MTAWRQVVATWWQTYGDKMVRAGDVWECVRGEDCPISFRGDNEASQKSSMGRLLARRDGSVFALVDEHGESEQYQIEQVKDTKGRPMYRLVSLGTLRTLSTHSFQSPMRARACARARTRAHGSIEQKLSDPSVLSVPTNPDNWQLVIEAARADDLHTAWIDQACYLVNGRDEVLVDIAFGSEDEAIQAAQMKVSNP
jgi:hypothetical protein